MCFYFICLDYTILLMWSYIKSFFIKQEQKEDQELPNFNISSICKNAVICNIGKNTDLTKALLQNLPKNLNSPFIYCIFSQDEHYRTYLPFESTEYANEITDKFKQEIIKFRNYNENYRQILLVSEPKKYSMKTLANLSSCTKYLNTDVIIETQSINCLNPSVRVNVDYFFISGVSVSDSHLQLIHNHLFSISFEEFKILYDACDIMVIDVNEDKLYSFDLKE